jgi:hypothetical protein
MSVSRYWVEIRGDAPPYKYRIKRQFGQTTFDLRELDGEASSREDAIFEASAAARDYEERRRWGTHVEKVELFEVTNEEPTSQPAWDGAD